MKKIAVTSASLVALLSFVASASAASFTAQDVATHNTASDCWSIISGKVYNLSSYATHPGGQAAITGLCGVDGTSAFLAKHASSTNANATLSSFLIGEATTTPATTTTSTTTPTTSTTTVSTATTTPTATTTLATTTPRKKFKFKGNVDNYARIINTNSNERIRIYVYADATLDPTKIDVKTAKFAGAAAFELVLRDLNKDKKMDGILSFRAKQMTELDKTATSSKTSATLTFKADGKDYSQTINVRVKNWKTAKQRLEEKKREELKAKLAKQKIEAKLQAQKKLANLKKQVEVKKQQLTAQIQKKKDDLRKFEEKKKAQIKSELEKRQEQISKRASSTKK